MALCLSLGAVALGGAVRSLKRRGRRSVGGAGSSRDALHDVGAASRHAEPRVHPRAVVHHRLDGGRNGRHYSITATLFGSSVLGRVNGVINLFHIGGAFIMQSGIGLLVAQCIPLHPGTIPRRPTRLRSWRCSRFSCWPWRGPEAGPLRAVAPSDAGHAVISPAWVAKRSRRPARRVARRQRFGHGHHDGVGALARAVEAHGRHEPLRAPADDGGMPLSTPSMRWQPVHSCARCRP